MGQARNGGAKASREKIPDVVVIGEREQQEQTVTLRRLGRQDQETMPAAEFRARIGQAIRTRAASF